MTTKRWLWIAAVLLGVLLLVYGVASWFAVRLTTRYEKATYTSATTDTAQFRKYFMDERTKPEQFGFDKYEELTIESDGLTLKGWFFPAQDTSSKRTVVCVHGRWSSRYRFVSLLELVKATKLDSTCNIFIPDLRNSGESDAAPTAFGYDFARDISHCIDYLHKRKGQTEFMLWAQSQGAMASLVYAAKPEHKAERLKEGVNLTGMLLESPLSNVPETVRIAGRTQGYPEWFINNSLFWVDRSATHGFMDSLQLSVLLPLVDMPTSILQTTFDNQTPTPVLEEELKELPNTVQPDLTWFEKGTHARIYFEPQNKPIYKRELEEAVTRAFPNLQLADSIPVK